MSQYTKDELWKIYETLPVSLKQAIFSEETANSVWDICQRNNIKENQVSKVAETVGFSLLGLLPLDSFASELINVLSIPQSTASRIYNEASRLIFYPIKESLEEIYWIKPKTEKELAGQKKPAPAPKESRPPEKIVKKQIVIERKAKPTKPDVYRESLEE